MPLESSDTEGRVSLWSVPWDFPYSEAKEKGTSQFLLRKLSCLSVGLFWMAAGSPCSELVESDFSCMDREAQWSVTRCIQAHYLQGDLGRVWESLEFWTKGISIIISKKQPHLLNGSLWGLRGQVPSCLNQAVILNRPLTSAEKEEGEFMGTKGSASSKTSSGLSLLKADR